MTSSRLRAFGAATLTAITATMATTLATAQAPPAGATGDRMEVQVVASACADIAFDAEQVWQLVRVELAGLGVDAKRATADEVDAARARPSAAVIAIECNGAPDTLTLRIYDMVGARELRREVVLTDVAEASRPRALALAAVGLLESSWLGLVSGEGAETSGLSETVHAALRARLVRRLETPPTVVEPSEPQPTSPPLLALSAALRAFPGRATGLVGLALSVSPSIAERARLALYTEALWSHGELAPDGTPIGRMNLYWLTAGVGLGWRVGEAPEVELGPRVLVGYAVADARPSAEDDGATDENGWVAAALLVATVRWQASDALHVFIEADLGYAPIGVSFDGNSAGMSDTTTALRFGLGW